MAEKCLERLGFELTTILDYSKLLGNFRDHFRGQGTTGQERKPIFLRPHWKGQYFAIGVLLPDASAKALEDFIY